MHPVIDIAVWSILLLQGLATEALSDRSEYLVEGLEHIEPAFAKFDGSMYAGLIPFDWKERQGNLMFWLFLPHKPSNEESLVMWLNGGPGCSSFDAGVAFENGPVKIPSRPAGYCCSSTEDPLEYNKYAWTHMAPMLYLEQPAGTGFSDGPEPHTEKDLAGDMHSFLENFFVIFDDMLAKRLFIFGESYAGMFVPSIARQIYLKNQEDSTVTINLAGIALGNGWMDAQMQGPTVIDYAWWHGMIDTTTRTLLHGEWEKCISPGNRMGAPLHQFTVPDECGIMAAVLQAAGKGLLSNRAPNTYDVTTWDTYPVLVSDDEQNTFVRFFNNNTVKEALHAPPDVEWRGCIPGAGRRRLMMLDQDRPLSVAPYLAQLMDDAKIRVLVYNGDRDMSTNSAGTELVLNGMKDWSGHGEWQAKTRGLWLDEKQEMAGWAKEFQRLSFVVVYNSGHLLPYNQPARALQLLERFLSNTSFVDLEIPRLEFADTSVAEEKWHERMEGRMRILVVGFVAFLIICVGIYATVSHSRRRQEYSTVSSESR